MGTTMRANQSRKHLVSLVLVFGLCAFASVGAKPYTPKAGSAERTAILDAVRGPLEATLNQKVIFVVHHMKVEGPWAFLKATQKTEASKPIDYKGTVFEEDTEFDELTVALLKKREGKWVSVNHAYFTSDVWWHGLWERYAGCPRSIFDHATGENPAQATDTKEAPGHPSDESDPRTAGEKWFKRADAELNRTYKLLQSRLESAQLKQELVKAQKAWIAFRDADAAFQAGITSGGGSAYSIDYMGNLAEMTEERTKELKALLKQFGEE